MALLYLLGQGVTQNNAMGAFYLKKAADKGNAWAMYHLGRLYYYGEGIPVTPNWHWTIYKWLMMRTIRMHAVC